MDNPYLVVAMRYVHIVSAILAVGGSSFLAMCLLPATRLVDETFRESMMQLVQKRFIKVLWLSIVGLIISGAFTWIEFAGEYKAVGKAGNILIGIKALLALILFVIIWAQNAGMLKLRMRAYLVINLHLAAIIILIAGVLRYLRLAM